MGKSKITKVETSATPPRPLPEINKEYNDLCARIGQARYQIQVVDNGIRNMLQRLSEIDVEATERAKLDKEEVKENV